MTLIDIESHGDHDDTGSAFLGHFDVWRELVAASIWRTIWVMVNVYSGRRSKRLVLKEKTGS